MYLIAYNEVKLDVRRKYLLSFFHIHTHSFVRYVMQVKADIICNKACVFEDFIMSKKLKLRFSFSFECFCAVLAVISFLACLQETLLHLRQTVCGKQRV